MSPTFDIRPRQVSGSLAVGSEEVICSLLVIDQINLSLYWLSLNMAIDENYGLVKINTVKVVKLLQQSSLMSSQLIMKRCLIIIVYMQKQTSIQQALKAAFPEFSSKSQLINYYVSFDFPEKQMKMVSWWQKVIEFIIEYENRAYVTYQELMSYLSIYNLKPTPLPAIINYLAKKDQLGPENQYEVRQALQTKNQQQKSWFNTLMSYVAKPSAKEESLFKFQGNERIFSRKIKEFKKQQIKKELNSIFTEHSKSINEFKLIQSLQLRVNLDKESIIQLLKQLDREEAIKLYQNQKRPFVLYSHNPLDFQNKQWCQFEKMKFCLREQIQKFEFMINKQEQKANKLKEKAKEQLANGNSKSSQAVCKQVIQRFKKVDNISTRRNLLENQITQLQYNEMNKTTLTLLEEAHAIYEQTMIDQNKLDEIVQKNMEIEISHKQTNEKMESMASKEDIEEDVDAMLRDLERQVHGKPARKEVSVEIPMEIQSGSWKKEKKEQPIEIEQNTKRVQFN